MPEHPQGELSREQAYLAAARHELARMREHTLGMKAAGGDRVSAEFLAHSLQRRAEQLVDDPTTALFFGRLDLAHPEHGQERWYIGRRHVNDERGDPVVIDWRADLSGAFYRASPARPMGVRRRRRFGVDHGRLTAYEDEHLLAPEAGDHQDGGSQPDPRRRDRAPSRRADARHRGDHPAGAGRDRAGRRRDDGMRAGRPRHRQDRGRPAPGGLAALRVPRPPGPLRRARRRPQPGVPRPHRRRAARARGGGGAAYDRGGARRRGRSPCAGPTPPRWPSSRGTPGWPRCCGGRCGRTSARPRRRSWCRAGRTSGGCRRPRSTRCSRSCGRGRSATRRPGRCCRNGSRTTCFWRWSAAATRPTTGCRTPSPGRPRYAPTSRPCGRGSTPGR